MNIFWAEEAQKDFDQAIAYLQERSRNAADRLGERILKSVAQLERFPEIAPRSRHRGLRQLVVPKTPYLIVYRIEWDVVEIQAVIHSSQKRRK